MYLYININLRDSKNNLNFYILFRMLTSIIHKEREVQPSCYYMSDLITEHLRYEEKNYLNEIVKK